MKPSYEELENRIISLEKFLNAGQSSEKNERYMRIADGISDHLYTVKVHKGKQIKTIMEKTCLGLTGYSSDEFSKDPFLWINMVHSDDRKKVSERFSEINRGHELPPIEHRIVCKDGNVKWILNTEILNYDKNNDLISYEGVIRNITERKEAELLLLAQNEELSLLSLEKNTILNNIGSGVFFLKNRKIIWANRKTAEMYGYTLEELSGISSMEFHLDKDAYDRFGSDSSEVLKKGLRFSIQVKQKKKSGEEFWCALSGQLIDEKPENEGVIWIADDVTLARQAERKIEEQYAELRKLNIELAEKTEQAVSASRMKSEFLASMSHEFRTPLNGVIGFAGLLSSTVLDENQQSYLENIIISAKSLLFLINDILDLSKIEAGKMELEMLKTDIISLFEETANAMRIHTVLKSLKLESFVSENCPRYAVCDPVRLKQVLLNILNNAVKFTEEGEINFRLECISKNSKTMTAEFRFSVADTGIGISAENQIRIFTAFTQADISTTRRYGGTGLGLAISNKLLLKMNSILKLKTETGKGSEFYFTVEMKFEEGELIKDINKIKKIIQYYSVPGSEPIILIADDNSVNLNLAVRLTAKILPDAKIISAKDGNEAVQMFKDFSPDLILMDVEMPKKDGYSAVKEIRNLEINKMTPVIALSAHVVAGERKKCIEAGMSDFISKPIDVEAFRNILLKYLNRIKTDEF